MKLNIENYNTICANPVLITAQSSVFDLPEKVIQFGTGVLLRGLCDQQIHQANMQGVFNGRIVIVKSTDKGDTSDFDIQNSLYTICVQGIDKGKTVKEYHVNSAVSRVLTATKEWDKILALATSSSLQVVISNTTEVGISLVNESVRNTCPQSYPGKLTGFLFERFYKAPHLETVVIPTELIVDNGTKLQEICKQLARFNELGEAFLDWLDTNVFFCNSLVDRIVPGKPNATIQLEIENELGYQDNLLCMAEAYNLWAIEGNEKIKSILTFEKVNEGVIIAPSIEIFRELKLRLLNGTHTLTCGLAFLNGKNLVRENMGDSQGSEHVKNLMLNELALALPAFIQKSEYDTFGNDVLNRFKNPFIDHKLLDITVQYTAKMVMRNIPLLKVYYERFEKAPELFSKGFAAYLLFMKAQSEENGKYFGLRNGEKYLINCDMASYFYQTWQANPNPKNLVNTVLSNQNIWGINLLNFDKFEETVSNYLIEMID
jgi:tagaturonate reductase